MTTLTAFASEGWYEITSEGIGTIYLAALEEGMVTGPSDTPANTPYRPRILNANTFSIKRSPQVWVWGPTGIQGAAFAQLEIDNYDGAYDFLLDNDVRDSTVVIKLPQAGALLTGTTMNDARTVATAIIDKVTSDNEDHITVTLKDVIARLDRSLPVRYFPPFVDSGAANNMIPLSFGAIRNRKPLLIDSANLIYQMHDTNIPNVTLVADKAAPLDPYASPPQYTPAVSGAGLQLASAPIGPLTVDCSSYGVQSVIPGADDVLAFSGGSYGDFTPAWVGSPSLPAGWSWSNLSGSVAKISNIFHSGHAAARITTSRVWVTGSGGDKFYFPSILQGGRSYRLNFSVGNIQISASTNPANLGGLMVATQVSTNPKDYISGYGTPINGIGTYPNPPSQNLSFEFTVPPGATRDLIFIVTTTRSGSSAVGTCSVDLWNVSLELLGQYQELPESGIPMHDYFSEILVHRAKEDSGIFNSTEAESLTTADDGSVIPFGIAFDQPPNILDALRQPLDSFCATMFTDHLGTLRVRQFTDPTDPSGAVLCDFGPANMERPIEVETDEARGLTTIIGARRNWNVFGQSDFVTDQAIVPNDIKTRFSRASQFLRTSSASPAGQYNFAIGAPVFDSLHDDAEFAQEEIDRVVSIYSPKVYPDGSFTNGKRRQITFTAHYDDPAAIGLTVKCDLSEILFGEIIRFTYPHADGTAWFVDQLGEVIAWEIFPLVNKITLTVEV